jgi:hypothetical protein
MRLMVLLCSDALRRSNGSRQTNVGLARDYRSVCIQILRVVLNRDEDFPKIFVQAVKKYLYRGTGISHGL